MNKKKVNLSDIVALTFGEIGMLKNEKKKNFFKSVRYAVRETLDNVR